MPTTALKRRARSRATAVELPHYELMSSTLLEHAFDHPNWIFEPKLDGLRVLCKFGGRHEPTLFSRNDKPQNKQFPDVVAAVHRSLPLPAVLDGEIVCLDERGESSFRVLQQRFHLEDEDEIARRAKMYPAYLYLFDLL